MHPFPKHSAPACRRCGEKVHQITCVRASVFSQNNPQTVPIRHSSSFVKKHATATPLLWEDAVCHILLKSRAWGDTCTPFQSTRLRPVGVVARKFSKLRVCASVFFPQNPQMVPIRHSSSVVKKHATATPLLWEDAEYQALLESRAWGDICAQSRSTRLRPVGYVHTPVDYPHTFLSPLIRSSMEVSKVEKRRTLGWILEVISGHDQSIVVNGKIRSIINDSQHEGDAEAFAWRQIARIWQDRL